jgi:hypothetical protein
MAQRLIDSPAVDCCPADETPGHTPRRWPADINDMTDERTPEDDRGRQEPDDPRDAPETPLDEPKPVPVQDPPAEPDTPPYVVRSRTRRD